MSKNMVILFFIVVLASAGYYSYTQGYFKREVACVDKKITAISDAITKDCTALEDDLQV